MSTDRATLQEAYVTTAQRWAKVRRYNDPAAFTRKVAVNLVRDSRKRSRRRSRAYLSLRPPADVAAPEPTTVAVAEALRRLPAEQREALALHYLLDMSVEQTARELRRPANTVKTQLARGRASWPHCSTREHSMGTDLDITRALADAADDLAVGSACPPGDAVLRAGLTRRRRARALTGAAAVTIVLTAVMTTMYFTGHPRAVVTTDERRASDEGPPYEVGDWVRLSRYDGLVKAWNTVSEPPRIGRDGALGRPQWRDTGSFDDDSLVIVLARTATPKGDLLMIGAMDAEARECTGVIYADPDVPQASIKGRGGCYQPTAEMVGQFRYFGVTERDAKRMAPVPGRIDLSYVSGQMPPGGVRVRIVHGDGHVSHVPAYPGGPKFGSRWFFVLATTVDPELVPRALVALDANGAVLEESPLLRPEPVGPARQ